MDSRARRRALRRALPSRVALAGAAAWLAGVLVAAPGPTRPGWPVALLLLGPLFVAPMALALVPPAEGARRRTRLAWGLAVLLQPAGAVALCAAFALPKGPLAALLSVPWLLVAALVALHGAFRFLARRGGPPSELAIDAGLVFLSIGAGWAFLERLGARPLGFGNLIVLLTAVHFHYAGLALPVATGLAARAHPTALARLACGGVIVGVPMVAAGITATQLGSGLGLEAAAAWITAAAAGLTGWLHLWLAARSEGRPAVVRALWGLAGGSLVFSMALAAAYGSRGVAPVPGLSIPAMWALHGTSNALGFALPALLGWQLDARARSLAASGAEPPEPGKPLRRRG